MVRVHVRCWALWGAVRLACFRTMYSFASPSMRWIAALKFALRVKVPIVVMFMSSGKASRAVDGQRVHACDPGER